LFKSGDYVSALAEFEAAHQLAPNATALYNIGMTQKQLFRYDDAIKSFRSYLTLAGGKPKGQQAEVENALRDLTAMTAEVRLQAKGPAGASVTVDGQGVGLAPLDIILYWKPGLHRIEVTLAGHRSEQKDVRVVSGDRRFLQFAPLATASAPTKLHIQTSPPNAALTLDGRPLGKAPWTGTLAPGGHRLLVELEGFHTRREEVLLAPGQTRTLSVPLSPVVAETPFFKRGIVWTVIGAAVLAGAIGTAYWVDRAGQPDQWLTVRP